jgi:hypothetical protein
MPLGDTISGQMADGQQRRIIEGIDGFGRSAVFQRSILKHLDNRP